MRARVEKCTCWSGTSLIIHCVDPSLPILGILDNQQDLGIGQLLGAMVSFTTIGYRNLHK